MMTQGTCFPGIITFTITLQEFILQEGNVENFNSNTIHIVLTLIHI